MPAINKPSRHAATITPAPICCKLQQSCRHHRGNCNSCPHQRTPRIDAQSCCSRGQLAGKYSVCQEPNFLLAASKALRVHLVSSILQLTRLIPPPRTLERQRPVYTPTATVAAPITALQETLHHRHYQHQQTLAASTVATPAKIAAEPRPSISQIKKYPLRSHKALTQRERHNSNHRACAHPHDRPINHSRYPTTRMNAYPTATLDTARSSRFSAKPPIPATLQPNTIPPNQSRHQKPAHYLSRQPSRPLRPAHPRFGQRYRPP